MVICPACSHSMSGSPDICEACGEPLSASAEDTRTTQRGKVQAVIKALRVWRSAQIGTSRTIKAHIGATIRTIRLDPAREVILGRSDLATGRIPDVDLAGHRALEAGLSRSHAALRLADGMVQVRDLGSTNGTFLNGQRVSTSEWRIVRSGDRLQLAELVMALHFVDTGEWQLDFDDEAFPAYLLVTVSGQLDGGFYRTLLADLKDHVAASGGQQAEGVPIVFDVRQCHTRPRDLSILQLLVRQQECHADPIILWVSQHGVDAAAQYSFALVLRSMLRDVQIVHRLDEALALLGILPTTQQATKLGLSERIARWASD